MAMGRFTLVICLSIISILFSILLGFVVSILYAFFSFGNLRQTSRFISPGKLNYDRVNTALNKSSAMSVCFPFYDIVFLMKSINRSNVSIQSYFGTWELETVSSFP